MLQRRFEKEIDLHKPLLELAQNAFRSFVRYILFLSINILFKIIINTN